jgi:hypothetical protein
MLLATTNLKGGESMVLNIKGFPDDLHRVLKSQAALEGLTVKALLIRLSQEYLDKLAKKKEKKR